MNNNIQAWVTFKCSDLFALKNSGLVLTTILKKHSGMLTFMHLYKSDL